MRICLLTTQDLDNLPLPGGDWPCDPRPFYEAEWHVEVMEAETSVAQVRAAIDRGYDLFFNLCDGAADQDDVPGVEVVQTLERAGVAFTGADSRFYEPSRDHMKSACHGVGVAAARGITVQTVDVTAIEAELAYPMFVKHPSSYASVDISRASRVVSRAGLVRQLRKMVGRYGGALVEEFIAGQEATVLVAENPEDPQAPITFKPLLYRFPPGETFKHEKLKWVDYAGLQTRPVEDPVLDAALRDASARFFVAIGGRSYGRCDIRIAEDGVPRMLEINPNCGLYYPPADAGSADLCLLADPRGHRGFTELIVRAALARA